MSKQAEREYPLRVDQNHLYTKPFDCPRVLREFGLVLEILQGLVPNGSILDLGCGSGWTSLFLARAGFQVLGVDISERMIEIADERSARECPAVDFAVQDIEELDLPKRDFDGVLLFDALHHCPGYRRVLQRAYEHLRPGGYLLLLEPSWLHHLSPHARAFSRQYGVTELGFSRWHLSRALKQSGFNQVTHYYDAGRAFRGSLGFMHACLRVVCSFLCCYPQLKQIALAQKPLD
jgi:SAM-dependent methyltransferase